MAKASCRHKARGVFAFTLVELLVVIAIIGILAALLMPTISRSKDKARQTYCASNLRQFGLGIEMYANQNKGTIPQKGPDGSGP